MKIAATVSPIARAQSYSLEIFEQP